MKIERGTKYGSTVRGVPPEPSGTSKTVVTKS